MVTALAGSNIDLAFLTTSNALGKVRDIGISGAKRWKQLPEVPAVAEAGIKGYECYAWFAFWYPGGTPAEIINRFHGELSRTVALPDVTQRVDEPGFGAYILKPDEFGKLVQKDIEGRRKLAARLGIQPQ